MRSIKLGVLATVVLCLFSAPFSVRAGEATVQLSATINDFVKILSNTPVAELQATGLPESARKLVFARFDFTEMAKRSLASHWASLEQEQQKEFVKAFTELLLFTYGRNVRASGNEKTVFNREVQDGGQASVETMVVSGKGEDLPIDYRLHDVNGQWKVYDVVIDHVSLINNYRAQFARVIAKSSVAELLKKLKEQNQES
ncbi:MAG TPA: ABC transporter substrate-binding protein [Methylomirabilota bacterium]|nr:ABC transporter substrate-binding protein [Methylomirabilota bacterium]